MKFRLFPMTIIMISCMIFVACTQPDKINGKQIGKELKNVLPAPDRIVIYDKGSIKEIDKKKAEFKKIIELTNKRFHDKLSTAQDGIDDSAMERIRKDGMGMEFIYSSERELSIKGDGFLPFKYYKLYFQLTSQQYGNSQGSTVHSFQYGDKDHYKDCSRGPLKYSDELVKLVEGLK